MNKQILDQNQTDKEAFEALESIYQLAPKEQPSVDIDRHILAAAHREMEHPNARKLPQSSWWRRLSLPIYVMATFTFATVATHLYWPAPIKMLPGTSSSPINFSVKEQSPAKPILNSKRHAENVPEPIILMSPPDMHSIPSEGLKPDRKDSLNAMLKDLDNPSLEQNDLTSEQSNAKYLSEGTHVAKMSFSDKDAWARDIIRLLKKGDYEAAKSSLTHFKKTYPDYPIDEQLKMLHQ